MTQKKAIFLHFIAGCLWNMHEPQNLQLQMYTRWGFYICWLKSKQKNSTEYDQKKKQMENFPFKSS